MRRPPWALRRTLVVATVALITLSALVIGIVSVLSVRTVLLDRIDAQLGGASSRSSDAFDGQGPPDSSEPPSGSTGEDPGDLVRVVGQSAGTLTVLVSGHSVILSGYVNDSGGTGALTEEQRQILLDAQLSGEPATVDLGGDLGEYRLVESADRDGVSLIVGLPLADTDSTIATLWWVVVAVTLLALVLASAAAYGLVRLTLRPLERVTHAATTVSRMTLDRGEVALAVRVPDQDADGRTEVGRVGAAINRMLEHVSNALSARQASEDKVRRFVSDASHELRTPLASIRGYAELTRMGGQELPEDAAYALGRIESESLRMTSIVEDLLLLARLDEGRQLESEPVDLVQIVTDAVSDARAASGGHVWNLDVRDEPVTVMGDHQRLFQVVMNLLANARTHTPEGTVVTVGLEVDRDRDTAVVTVHDTGQGIDPEIVDLVFERFVRGDSSRARTTGSTGLGLAIVSGVVAAHGGTASVESRPGSTEFRIELPLA